jgi:hypothetical protein
LNFGKLSGLFLMLGVAFCLRAFADGVAFTQSGASLPAGTMGDQTSSVSQLKYQAVLDYLQRISGAHYAQFERQVNAEFAEKYILDYKVSRQMGNLTVSGHIDGDGLRRWVHLLETKTRGTGSLSPYFILSSSIPGLTITPNETAARMRDSTVAQQILELFNGSLHKFNVRISLADLSSLGATAVPPRTEGDIRDLGKSPNNAALWVNLLPCKTCGGVRLDTYLYQVTLGKLLIARSDDLILEPKDFANREKLKSVLKEPMKQFQSDFEEMVSSGGLSSGSYRLSVEGVDSYRAYKLIEGELSKQDYIAQVLLKHSESRIAEFEVRSSIPSSEISQRLGQFSFPGFKLKPVRVDSKSVVVRYLKEG